MEVVFRGFSKKGLNIPKETSFIVLFSFGEINTYQKLQQKYFLYSFPNIQTGILFNQDPCTRNQDLDLNKCHFKPRGSSYLTTH